MVVFLNYGIKKENACTVAKTKDISRRARWWYTGTTRFLNLQVYWPCMGCSYLGMRIAILWIVFQYPESGPAQRNRYFLKMHLRIRKVKKWVVPWSTLNVGTLSTRRNLKKQRARKKEHCNTQCPPLYIYSWTEFRSLSISNIRAARVRVYKLSSNWWY